MEVCADLEGLHAELRVLYAVVKDNVRIAGIGRNAGPPFVRQLIKDKPVIRVRHRADIGVLDLCIVLVRIQFVKIRWQHRL